ncbi:hypothetical protein D9F30_25205 [Escherichia coli]|nr:hypothetical protein [Escherichia coli]
MMDIIFVEPEKTDQTVQMRRLLKNSNSGELLFFYFLVRIKINTIKWLRYIKLNALYCVN